MFFDILFQVWRRFSARWQWWSLWLVSSKFMVSVSGVVINQRGAILLQRHRHWVHDVWGLPGGIVNRGETLESAFAREVLEETGLVVSDVEMVRVLSGYKLRLEVYFRARLSPGMHKMKLQECEVLEARFFALDDLPPNLLSKQKEIIETVRNMDKVIYASD